MACSKIFSGDLPELTDEIIQYFRKDLSTLYSCILVNRLWCRLAIPLLWEYPFSIPKQHYHCIKTYLCFLNEDSKAKIKAKFNEYGINEYVINDNLSLSNTLFNYPSFIKYLDIDKFLSSIDNVVGRTQIKLVNLIYRSLLEVFIKNEGNLHSFKVVLPTIIACKYFNDNMDLILQNPNFTCNIRNLILNCGNDLWLGDAIISSTFLKFLYSNCNSISSIFFKFFIYDINNRSLIEKHLSQIIISQHNLKKISFESDYILYNLFLSLKNSNCSNTLNTIIFHYTNFNNIVSILQEVFDQLNVLESIHLFYCRSLNSDFVQQIIKVNKPFKLRSLFMKEILHVEPLQLLLEKFGDYLENFGFGKMSNEYNEPKRQLFKSIMEYCTKIRYFDSGIPDDNNIYLFIKNNQHNINYLTIEVDVKTYTNYDKLISTVLQNLGQVLPPKLEYLNLSLSIVDTSDLERFFKNSQNTFIKKLLIVHGLFDISESILFCIKEYIMKKERIKYLAIINSFNKELFTLKNEVNEFKLHNIIVKKFYDLYFSPYSFVENNYL